jgi:hypothetical protein
VPRAALRDESMPLRGEARVLEPLQVSRGVGVIPKHVGAKVVLDPRPSAHTDDERVQRNDRVERRRGRISDCYVGTLEDGSGTSRLARST